MIVLGLLVACTDAESPAGDAPVSRVETVAAAPAKVESPQDFCDTYWPAETAKPFAWPPLADAAPREPGTWQWVNVWATWCGPCVGEMPMVVGWTDKLAKSGVKVDLALLSVDSSDGDVKRFRAKHADWPPSLLIRSTDDLAPWFSQVGVDVNTAIPLHLFVDPERRLRCARAGALSDGDYATIAGLLGS